MATQSYESVSWQRNRLAELLSLVTNNARDRWPRATYMMNSDVAWRLPGSDPKNNLQLWLDEKGIAAYAWFEANSPITMDLRTDLSWDDPVAADLLTWLESRRSTIKPFHPWLINLTAMTEWENAIENDLPQKTGTKRFLQVTALDEDQERIRFLESNGYERTEHFHYFMSRSLDTPIPGASLPEDITLHHVLDSDFSERVATHRDAWFKSSFDMGSYLAIRNIEVFEPTLDIVANHNGTFASYCIGWVDHELGIGSFEPVGTRPAYRRMGLGREVNYEGLRRMRALGMHSAQIGTAGFNNRAFGLYQSCGFDLVDRERTYIKEI
jgi:ribosomal protein S18 acetylase RimI-like enzyme